MAAEAGQVFEHPTFAYSWDHVLRLRFRGPFPDDPSRLCFLMLELRERPDVRSAAVRRIARFSESPVGGKFFAQPQHPIA